MIIFKRASLKITKGGKFLKKLWCCVGGEYYKMAWVDNVNWPPLRDSKADVSRGYSGALRRSESRNCGICVLDTE